MFAILDIETTGGSPKTEKITEIAIFFHDGEKIVDEWNTLINPEKQRHSGRVYKNDENQINE